MTRVSSILCALAMSIPLPAQAQPADRPAAHLPTADVRFPEPFSDISGIRELSDGRVVVADRLEKTVRVLDLGDGTFRTIGRVGQGPGEYELPGRLLPLPGDSTMLVDFANTRLSIIDPQGRILGSVSMMHGTDGMIVPDAADRDGRVYFRQMSFSMPTAEPPDSLPIVRWDRARDVLETVAKLPLGQMASIRIGAGGGGMRGTGINPFAGRDQWTAAPDGRVALLYVSDYHIEWVQPDGQQRSTGPVAYTPVPVTDADKEAWDEGGGSMGVGMVVTSRAGSGASGSRTIDIPRPSAKDVNWPDVKPPFPANAARFDPDGALWVERHVPAGRPPRFDVFDQDGRVVRRIELPAERQLLGFGRGSVYLVYEDPDGLQWIERYRR
jgi:hypothetical protein